MTFAIILPAIIACAAGLVMMTPPMRRRAANRGLSGSIEVPALIAVASLIALIGKILL